MKTCKELAPGMSKLNLSYVFDINLNLYKPHNMKNLIFARAVKCNVYSFDLKIFTNLNYRKTVKKDGIPNILIDWTLNMLIELYVSAGKRDVTTATLNEKCKVR